MTISAFAPGKIILMGEHAVVYGHPALAMAIDRGLTVTLTDRAGPTTMDAEWIDDPRLAQALHAVLPSEGVGVQIESTLPIGRGMGSSAALAVALARASLTRSGLPLSPEAIDERAFAVERVFHGNPSGIDHTVSMRGGALLYRKMDEKPTFEVIQLPPLPIVVIDSGYAGDTAQMVGQVRDRFEEVEPYLEQMGHLVLNTIPALQAGDLPAIGQAWHENHWLLRAAGVSTNTLDDIVQTVEDAGAYGAKLAGAGGGGVVIALTDHPAAIIEAAVAKKWHAFQIFSPA
jgi:mevalonate kinase